MKIGDINLFHFNFSLALLGGFFFKDSFFCNGCIKQGNGIVNWSRDHTWKSACGDQKRRMAISSINELRPNSSRQAPVKNILWEFHYLQKLLIWISIQSVPGPQPEEAIINCGWQTFVTACTEKQQWRQNMVLWEKGIITIFVTCYRDVKCSRLLSMTSKIREEQVPSFKGNIQHYILSLA